MRLLKPLEAEPGRDVANLVSSSHILSRPERPEISEVKAAAKLFLF
jgi:hypothetical protein